MSITVGATVTLAAEVVKRHTKLLTSAWPEVFCAPVVTVATYVLFGTRSTDGVKTALAPEAATLPATLLPSSVKVIVLVLSVAVFICSLKVTAMLVLIGTLVAPTAGAVKVTVGGKLVTPVVPVVPLVPVVPVPPVVVPVVR